MFSISFSKGMVIFRFAPKGQAIFGETIAHTTIGEFHLTIKQVSRDEINSSNKNNDNNSIKNNEIFDCLFRSRAHVGP